MDNDHYFDSRHRATLREQRRLADSGVLPELTEEVERLLAALQVQEVDADEKTIARVLEQARKA
jgi:hypothetical protein